MGMYNREDNLRALGLDPWEVPTAVVQAPPADAQSTKGKSFMNWQQALSALRTALKVGGPLSGLLIALGYTHTEELSKGVEALIALLSVVPPVLGGVWSWFSHTKSNAVAVVAAMDGPEKQQAFLGVPDALKVIAANAVPGVQSIKIAPGAPAALTAIAEDRAHPKVTQ